MTHTVYEIRVAGLVGEDVVAELGDVRVSTTAVSTVLSSEILDQAALLGVLARLRSLNLDVLEVRRVLTADGADDGIAGAPAPDEGARPAWTPRGGGAAHDRRGHLLRGSTTAMEQTDQTAALTGAGRLADLDESGPIDFMVVEFPGSRMTGEGFAVLVDLVDRGVIRIIDLAFVSKGLDGTVAGLTLTDVDGDGELDLTFFEGASSGLLDDSDLDDVGTVLEPGSSAGVLVYENVWAGPFASAIRRSGGRLVAGGRIPVQAVLAVLDAAGPVG